MATSLLFVYTCLLFWNVRPAAIEEEVDHMKKQQHAVRETESKRRERERESERDLQGGCLWSLVGASGSAAGCVCHATDMWLQVWLWLSNSSEWGHCHIDLIKRNISHQNTRTYFQQMVRESKLVLQLNANVQYSMVISLIKMLEGGGVGVINCYRVD